MTVRLARLAVENWAQMDGFAVSQNLPDLRTMPLDRFCSFVQWFATRNAESEADIAKFEAALWTPPKGQAGQGPWAPEAENAAFAGLKAGLGQ